MRSPTTLRICPSAAASNTAAQLHALSSPSCESLRSSSSDASDYPVTPTFSAHGHVRNPSSTSSLSSTPPGYEYTGISRSTGALPDTKQPLPLLEEDPLEKDIELPAVEELSLDDDETVSPCLCDDQSCAHQVALSTQSADLSASSTYLRPVLSLARATKRRSGDSHMLSIATRAQTRLSSISRRFGDRKSRVGTSSVPATVCSTPARSPSSCSTSSIAVPLTTDLASEKQSTTTSVCVVDEIAPVSPIDIAPLSTEDEIVLRESLATTPLLPPMMIATRGNDDTPLQSPLESPTVASPQWDSPVHRSPANSPQLPGHASPPLSSKLSVASFHPRPGYMVPSAEIPPIMIADPTDEWSIKLGHANFTIQPEPYLPEVCDAGSCRRLFSDWERARRNFVKHHVRTGEHYGVTSKTYLMTEQKWAEIDALWKKNKDIAEARAANMCDSAVLITPTEPAPLVKLPFLNDPKSDGKFPKLGDEDIVGPMVQIASQMRPQPSKRGTWLRLFGGLKFTDSLTRRSVAAAYESH